MKPRPDLPAPVGEHRSLVSRGVGWYRGHKRAGIAVSVVTVVLVAGGVIALLGGGGTKAKPPAQALSHNPAVAGYEKQLPALAAAVRAKPKDQTALRAYGVALYATGDVSRAKQEYEAELKVNPSDPVLLNNLGNVYRDLGTYDKALVFYQRAIARDPKSPTAYVNLANLYQYTLNQKKLAIKTIQEARRNLPDNPDLGVLLGIAYEQIHDKTNARAAFKAVLGQNPANAAAQAGMKRLGA
jgi:Flp pilus assembly protein TadD